MKAIGLQTIFQWIKAGYKAIPFSWLIDFFVKTKRFMDLFNVGVFSDLGYAPIEVISSAWSLKTDATIECWTHDHPSFDAPYSPIRLVGIYQVKSFFRGPGLPLSGEGGWLRYHSLSDNLSMLAILLQILFPGIRWGKR
jgi:hypothetical protein